MSVYIRTRDIPYSFNYDELNSYNIDSPIKSTRRPSLCIMSFVQYVNDEQQSYIECSDIDDEIAEHGVLCQYDNTEDFEKSCNDIYKKCYVFIRTESVKNYIHDNIEKINNEITKHLTSRNITTPFSKEIGIETIGYKDELECSKIDYAVMLGLMGGLFSPFFAVYFDKNWGLSSISLCVPYNTYSIWAKRFDLYEMQDSDKLSKFSKLVNRIDHFLLTEKSKITDFPKRIEILAKDLRIPNIDTLRSFMRHFYVGHGTAWDTGSPDSCICSIENYNGTNLNGCKFIIDIQGEHFFDYYDLKTHTLDNSNCYFDNR